MKRINLEQKILNIKGEVIKIPIPVGKEKILVPVGEGKPQMRDSILRDYLLTLLASRFQIIDNKESWWTTELGILIADEKNKEIEISDDKFKFLKRIIEKNKMKIIQTTPMGPVEKEVEIFYPFELGQLLKIFE